MRVRATQKGLYGSRMREEGDVFEVKFGNAKETAKVVEKSAWLEPVGKKKAEEPADDGSEGNDSEQAGDSGEE